MLYINAERSLSNDEKRIVQTIDECSWFRTVFQPYLSFTGFYITQSPPRPQIMKSIKTKTNSPAFTLTVLGMKLMMLMIKIHSNDQLFCCLFLFFVGSCKNQNRNRRARKNEIMFCGRYEQMTFIFN